MLAKARQQQGEIAKTDGPIVIQIAVRPAAKRREQLGGPVVVYLQRDPTKPERLEHVSPLLGQLRDEYDQHVKKCRLYVHPAVAQRLRDAGQLDAARSELRKTLRGKVGL